MEWMKNKVCWMKNENKEGEVSNDWWRWLVLVLAVTNMILRYASFFCFSIILAELNTIYNTSITELAIISVLPRILGSLLGFLPLMVKSRLKRHPNRLLCLVGNTTMGAGLLLSSIVNSPSWLFLTYAGIVGVGVCLVNIGSMAAIGDYFPEGSQHFVLASSIVLISVPLAKTIFQPLTYLVIEHSSWREAFVFLGCCSLIIGNLCAFSFTSKEFSKIDVNEKKEENEMNNEKIKMTGKNTKSYQSLIPSMQAKVTGDISTKTQMKKREEEEEAKKDEDTTRTNKIEEKETLGENKIIENNNFVEKDVKDKIGLWRMLLNSDNKLEIILFLLSFLMYTTCFSGIAGILPHYLTTKSFVLSQQSTILTTLAVIEVIVLALAAGIGCFFKKYLIIVYIIGEFGIAAVFISYIFVNTYKEIFISSIFLGIPNAFVLAYLMSVATEVTQMSFEVTWAFVSIAHGLGILMIPLVTGVIYDIDKNYQNSLLVMSLLLIYSSFIVVVICIIKKCKKRNVFTK